MFGAETLLMNRARNREVFDKTVDLINHFKEYFMSYSEKINENPSPGNKAGGGIDNWKISLGFVSEGNSRLVECPGLWRQGDEKRPKLVGGSRQ